MHAALPPRCRTVTTWRAVSFFHWTHTCHVFAGWFWSPPPPGVPRISSLSPHHTLPLPPPLLPLRHHTPLTTPTATPLLHLAPTLLLDWCLSLAVYIIRCRLLHGARRLSTTSLSLHLCRALHLLRTRTTARLPRIRRRSGMRLSPPLGGLLSAPPACGTNSTYRMPACGWDGVPLFSRPTARSDT